MVTKLREEPEAGAQEAIAREIAACWSSAGGPKDIDEAMPAFLQNPLLVDLVGTNSNVVVQVLDMRRFKSVYVSPNIVDVCGLTPQEINDRGVLK